MKPRAYAVFSSERNMPLVNFLAARLGLSMKRAKRLLDSRAVFVNEKRVWMARHSLMPGDRVEVHNPAPAPQSRRPHILYDDSDVVVVNKPAGLLSNGPTSLEQQLKTRLNAPALAAIHRLDRDTSGCIVFARNAGARDAMLALFRAHKVRKTYHAIAIGRISRGSRNITVPVDGQPARTRLTVLVATNVASHLRLEIETGRTHQIRRHMVSIGHPLVGAKVHATSAQPLPELRNIPRQMLHAAEISFPHPRTGATVRVSAPFPPDFRLWLRQLDLE
jgi:23S rRNA pseudouridine1911/1915/1917 synthase